MGRRNHHNLCQLTVITILLVSLTIATGCPVNQQSSQSGPSGKTGTSSPTPQATAPADSPATPGTTLVRGPDWPADGSIKAYA